MMQRFARWHIWLGWVVALPILMWVITGLLMVARPIEAVRGENLLAKPAAIDPARVTFPGNIGEPVSEVRLVSVPGQGVAWIVTAADGRRWRYSADGTASSPVVEAEARRIAQAAYTGKATLASLTYYPAEEVPLELRRQVASWRAHFTDGTNVYIDDVTGEVLAVRTGGWRLYDLMWGLHIMDPQTREDSHNPFVVVFAALSLLGAGLGAILLFRRRKARVKA